MTHHVRADAAEIAQLCAIAGRASDAPAFINAGLSPAKVRAQLELSNAGTLKTEPPFKLFDPGIGVRISDKIDVAAIEDAARAAGRLR